MIRFTIIILLKNISISNLFMLNLPYFYGAHYFPCNFHSTTFGIGSFSFQVKWREYMKFHDSDLNEIIEAYNISDSLNNARAWNSIKYHLCSSNKIP